MSDQSQPSIFTSIIDRFTPTVLFILLNVVIAIIALSHTKRRREQNHIAGDAPTSADVYRNLPPPIARGRSSLIDRLRSINQHQNADEIYRDLPPPIARGPSAIIDRLRSFNLHRFVSGEVAADPEPQEASPPSPVVEDQHHHYERSRSDSGEEKANLASRIKKSASTSSAFAHFEASEIVRRPAARSAVPAVIEDEVGEVDARADDFINRFRHQLKLQRLDSLLRYKEMIKRS